MGRFVDYEGVICFKPSFRRILVDGNMIEKDINNSLIFLSEGDNLNIKGYSFIFRE